ncbi:RNase H-like domain-containing protein [Acinetobacter baumannii]|uniref:RNase H-like domain-containing protein n=1 Tax=Acinetobacter baumannii TaxID=470 RepID=UPI0033990D4A
MKNCPRPLTPTNIRSFLGLAGYYQRFTDVLVTIASSLTTLTQKCKNFERLEACKKSFRLLKHSLTSSPVLTLSEGMKGFVVYCDASRVGFGCFLRVLEVCL